MPRRSNRHRLPIAMLTGGFAPGGAPPAGDNDIFTFLESWWALEEAAGAGTRFDSHGANDMTAVNTPGQGTGVVGNAVDPERDNNEYLSIVDNVSVSTGDIDYSFSFWFKAEVSSDAQYAISKDVSGHREYAVKLVVAGDLQPQFYMFTSTVFKDAQWGSVLNDATWYHVFVYHDAGANTIGMIVDDGTPVITATGGGHDTGEADFRIAGLEFNDGSSFDGLIDEVAYWKNYIPTAAEITALYNAGAGMSYATFLAAYGPAAQNWWLAGGVDSGDVVAVYQPIGAADLADSYIDLSGNGNNAAPGVAPTWASGDGWTFNGTTQYLDSGIIPLATTWTYIVRFSDVADAGSYVIASQDTTTIGVTPNNSGLGQIRYIHTSGNLNGAALHSGGVFAIADREGYFDGLPDGTMNAAGAIPNYSIYMGARNAAGSANGLLTGKIQAVAIYSGTLDASQVALITQRMQGLTG